MLLVFAKQGVLIQYLKLLADNLICHCCEQPTITELSANSGKLHWILGAQAQ